MSMTIANANMDPPHQLDGRFALPVLAVALATLIVVPGVALAISYLIGGVATSEILLVYFFAILTGGPFLGAALALTIFAAAGLAVSHFTSQAHA